MEQSCEPDGRIPIQGNRWLSMIAISETGASGVNRGTFPIDDELLYQKLAALRQTVQSPRVALVESFEFARERTSIAIWRRFLSDT